MNIITGKTGEAHVTSAEAGAVNIGAIGSRNVILSYKQNLSTEVKSLSLPSIQVNPGVFVIEGRAGIVSVGEVIQFDRCSTGYTRIDVIEARYVRSGDGTESMGWAIVQGTAVHSGTTPTVPIGHYEGKSIIEGDSFVDTPVYRVTISGSAVTGIETMLPIAPHTISSVAIPSSSRSVAFSLPSMCKIMAFGNSVGYLGEWLVRCQSSGSTPVMREIVAPSHSSVSASVSTGAFTLTNGAAGNITLYVDFYEGEGTIE